MARSREAIKAAQARYEKSGAIKRVCVKFHKVYDADILEKLDSTQNVTGYIKDLIRNDIKRQG